MVSFPLLPDWHPAAATATSRQVIINAFSLFIDFLFKYFTPVFWINDKDMQNFFDQQSIARQSVIHSNRVCLFENNF